MATYVSKHLSLNVTSQSEASLQQVLATVDEGQVGVLVLGAGNSAGSDVHKASSLKMTMSPTEVIQAAADVSLSLASYTIYKPP